MPFSTIGVVSAVTPSVIETYFSHYLNRGPLRQKPTAHISYHEGLRLIRQFLDYSSKHTVEDLQAFTAQWVPAPHWVRIEVADIALPYLEQSAKLLQTQLGATGIEKIGGKSWWQWRRPESPMRAEWIEMKKDVSERRHAGTKCDRAMLYVHGGAYYFGSVDEHRYQMQRHARKLKAKVFAPRYRLAPQFPFPCGLQDCIAAYLFLLEHFHPTQILIAGDSAGGGMVLSMLVTLRDQGKPLPAGAILLSPWVDLTHSFPSVAGDGLADYIPAHGFHHRPSLVWPPPDSDELRKMTANDSSGSEKARQFQDLSVNIDGKIVEIKDQIQLYAPNHLLAHPLVSPVQQPSLGGLPPMLVQAGGGELLRDEQIYIAHKAANPTLYPPDDAIVAAFGLNKDDINKYPPTDVQLQVWEDLCHVPQTLSFTRPAKYMYRSIAQFGAWALANAQHKSVDIVDDDAISFISSGPETDNDESASIRSRSRSARKRPATSDGASRLNGTASGVIGKAGDPLPHFKDHMIRQGVTRHGVTYPLAVPSELACLHLDPASIGAIKPGPVRKWLAHKTATDAKFASEKKKVQKRRLKEMSRGYEAIGQGERPPPTALAGRRKQDMPAEKKIKKSWGLAMWSGWGSSHDEQTIEKEAKMERDSSQRRLSDAETVGGEAQDGSARSRTPMPASPLRNLRRASQASMLSAARLQQETMDKPKSRLRSVVDAEQPADGRSYGENLRPNGIPLPDRSRTSSPAVSLLPSRPESQAISYDDGPSPGDFPGTSHVPTTSELLPESLKVEGSDSTYSSPTSNRPHNGTVAYPFKIRNPMFNPSTTTLDSQSGEPGSSSAGAAGEQGRSSTSRSVTPSIAAASEKEIAVPYVEKEVVFHPVADYRPERRPEARSAVEGDSSMQSRMRSVPSDPRLNTQDTRSVSGLSSNSSVPTSPDEQYRQNGYLRNPAFDRQNAAVNKFGGPQYDGTPSSPDDRIQPVHPKPVGFAYNPRDLRAAMLNRQAAESASAAAVASGSSAGPSPSDGSQHGFSRQPEFAPVELAAVPVYASYLSSSASYIDPPRGNDNAVELSAHRRSAQPDEFSSPAVPYMAPLPQAPAAVDGYPPLPPDPPPPAPNGKSSREIPVHENVTMPVIEPRRPVMNDRQTPSPSTESSPKQGRAVVDKTSGPEKKKSLSDLIGRKFPSRKASDGRDGTSGADAQSSAFITKSPDGANGTA